MAKAVSNLASSQECSIIIRLYALKAHKFIKSADLHFIRVDRQLAGNQKKNTERPAGVGK